MDGIEKYLVNIAVKGYKCKRCNHSWLPRKRYTLPFMCPGCKSTYWHTKKKKKLTY